MNFTKFFFVLLFLTIQFANAQETLSKEIKFTLNTTISEEEKIFKLENLKKKYKNYPNSPQKGILNSELGVLYFNSNNKEYAISCLKNSISILKDYKKNNAFLLELNRSRSNLAWIYMLNKEVSKQYDLLNEIIKDKALDKYTFNAKINIAILDSERGDYYLALKRLDLLLLQKNDINNEIIIRTSIVKIFALMTELDSGKTIKIYESGIKKHQKFVEINFKISSLDNNLLFEFYNNLANIYEAWGENKTALSLYIKSKDFFKSQNNSKDYFSVLNNIGFLHAKQNQLILASNCFKEIIKKSSNINQIATAYDNFAYFSNIKPVEKITYFQKAIQIILDKEQSSFELPKLETIIDSGYQQDIMVYLVDLAFNYVESYKNTKNKAYLFKAKEVLYLIDEIVSVIRYESTTDQSKLFWIEKGVNTYLLGAEVCFLLNKPDEGFYFMEKNKALLLQENIKKYQAKLELQVPKSITEKEFKLHNELLTVEKKNRQFPNSVQFKKAYLKKLKEYESYMGFLVAKYPQYARFKQKIDIIPLKKVIHSLDNEECFVSYILTDDKGYGLFVNKSEKIFYAISNVSTLQKDIRVLKKNNSQVLLDKQESIQFQSTSANVFKSLFPFENAINKIKNKRLIIVADDSLINLPFESLCVYDSKKYLKNSYLINFSEISYLQSFSTFEKIKQWKSKASKKLILTVPYQFEDKSLTNLSRSKEVIDKLEKYTSTTVLFDDAATKEKFCSLINQYQIIHLNTHAGLDISDQKTPWIAFRNSKMTLEELYGIQNQAELVILDACKTNDGQIQSGEGVLSLSRGFFMNGTKSVLSSLWNVNEKAGNEIILSFYNELEKGKTKSKALQLAKINYLKHHQLSEVLPYHWASFVLTGDTASIELNQKWYYHNYILILLAFTSIIITVLLIKFIFLKK
ncbi:MULTISPECIES: CHAT domain-containing protein [Flavobacterium]|uniref:CHAT domain-containing protein n=1 Tax=Flavobacterium hankyongi TaxID=1176532 RepID=A0ABP9A4M8_9FLAO|nr:CHAT domain-containing protein [Flavobacterium sp. N1846]